jgi:peptide chain release factor 2
VGRETYQVRSYVLDGHQPRVKDLRTAVETSDVEGVLDGDIDIFLEAALVLGVGRRTPDKVIADAADRLA